MRTFLATMVLLVGCTRYNPDYCPQWACSDMDPPGVGGAAGVGGGGGGGTTAPGDMAQLPQGGSDMSLPEGVEYIPCGSQSCYGNRNLAQACCWNAQAQTGTCEAVNDSSCPQSFGCDSAQGCGFGLSCCMIESNGHVETRCDALTGPAACPVTAGYGPTTQIILCTSLNDCPQEQPYCCHRLGKTAPFTACNPTPCQ